MRLVQFFEANNGRLSMSRLLCFLSFFPATQLVMSINTAEALGYYLGAYVLSYVGGKLSDKTFKDNDRGE